MNQEMRDDYFLNINWNDLEKNTHRIGFLALYNEKFYFKIDDEEYANSAYSHGFDGIPGVQQGRVYMSKTQMFDIITKRIGIDQTDKKKIDIIKQLISNRLDGSLNSQNQLTNKRDKISFDEMTEMQANECKNEIDEYYKKNEGENSKQEDNDR